MTKSRTKIATATSALPIHVDCGPITMRARAELIAYERNPRKHPEKQMVKLMASMRRHGFNQPVLVTASSEIIAGHARVEAAKRLHLVAIPAICLDHLTPAQVREYRLADNQLGTLSQAFSAQYQQNPVLPEGNLVRIKWFGRVDELPEREECQKIVQSWDTGMSDNPTSNPNVCLTGSWHEERWHLLDVLRERLAYPDLRRAVLWQKNRWKADHVVIEGRRERQVALAGLSRRAAGEGARRLHAVYDAALGVKRRAFERTNGTTRGWRLRVAQ